MSNASADRTLTPSTGRRGEYELAGVGTLRQLGGWEGEARVDGTTWTLRRPRKGMSLHATVVDESGEPVAELAVAGLRHSTLRVGERTLKLRSRGVVRTHFELCEEEHVLVQFRPGRSGEPLQFSVAEPVRVEPLPLLICCLVVLAARDSS